MTGAATDPFGLVGATLDGQYRVDGVVGEGGFGVVYRGYHLAFQQPIAIKALKIPAVDARTQASVLEKFKEEGRLLYELSLASLNIVRSIGFGAVTSPAGAWAPYVVLEWLEGRSLAADLAERRAAGLAGRALDETIALLEPAARGLIAAHHKRVAHRDVKPANVFLTRTTDVPPKPTAKVLDFGIAKVLLPEGQAATHATGFISFTPYYAAPEQLDPRFGATGLHTDVYAFALVLVEVLTGRLPVDGEEVVAIAREATDPARRPTPRARGAAVPDVVEAVFARALAVDPRARHADLEQLWDALTKALAAASPTGTVAIPSVGQRHHAHVATQPMPASAAPASPPMRAVSPSLVTPPAIAVPSGPALAPRVATPVAPHAATAPPGSAVQRAPSAPPAPWGAPPGGLGWSPPGAAWGAAARARSNDARWAIWIVVGALVLAAIGGALLFAFFLFA